MTTGPGELLIVLVVILLIFGPGQRSVEVTDDAKDDAVTRDDGTTDDQPATPD